MPSWNAVFRPTDSDAPRFVQIAQQLIDDISRGRLAAGQRLPGSRQLARSFGVTRNTVVAALAELEAQGWLHASPTRGTFVADVLPTTAPLKRRRAAQTFSVPLPERPLSMRDFDDDQPRSLSGGMPDPRLFPVEELARAWRRVLRLKGARLLEYGHPAGHPALREALAEMVRTVRAIPATASHVLVTRGSQMALDLAARALVSPGDTVAVERLGYRPAWDALRLAGAKLVPLPVDTEGLQVEALERVPKLRAVYLTPHHQYPTTVTLSARRRLKLLELARRRRFAILEDDYDHEFHYEGRPVLPLASTDEAGVVVYIGTLSKVLAPGLRLGFLVAPPNLVDHLAQLRAVMDRQGDHPMEAAVAELIDDGTLQRHIRKMRTAYLARRDALVHALENTFSAGELSWQTPRGGISVWATSTRSAASFERFRLACGRAGVHFAPGAQYSFDRRSLSAVRLVFSRSTEAELTRAVTVMRRCWSANT